jgi:hypothetical protein
MCVCKYIVHINRGQTLDQKVVLEVRICVCVYVYFNLMHVYQELLLVKARLWTRRLSFT